MMATEKQGNYGVFFTAKNPMINSREEIMRNNWPGTAPNRVRVRKDTEL